MFLAISAVNLYISRKSLRSLRSHGFYRFFAFEMIAGLVVMGLRCWFCEPFSWHQLISWPLLIVSLFLVIHSIRLLRVSGKPGDARGEAPLIGFEKTTRLVTSGAYRYIRHPLYSSLLCLAWGAYFKDPNWLGSLLAVAATTFLFLTAKMEEAENIGYFGEEYRRYMQVTKRFIPFIF